MSAQNRGAKRHPKDFYRTPTSAVHRLLDKHGKDLPAGRWADPGAGNGAIIRAVRSYQGGAYAKKIRFHAYEVRRTCEPVLRALVGPDVRGDEPSLVIGDYLRREPEIEFDVTVGNPPFTLAQEFVDAARRRSRVVALLLRLNFFGSDKRIDWWPGATPDRVSVLPNRPIFSLNKHGKVGSDATEYAWFLWGVPRILAPTDTIMDILPRTDPKVRSEENKELRQAFTRRRPR